LVARLMVDAMLPSSSAVCINKHQVARRRRRGFSLMFIWKLKVGLPSVHSKHQYQFSPLKYRFIFFFLRTEKAAAFGGERRGVTSRSDGTCTAMDIIGSILRISSRPCSTAGVLRGEVEGFRSSRKCRGLCLTSHF